MIPTNLDECFVALKKIATKEDIEEIKSRPEKDMIEFHNTIGRWMRNEWGLWSGGPLQDYFKDMGLWHADDMSGLILRSFWRHLMELPLDIEDQIKQYFDYWKNNYPNEHP